MRKNLYIIKLYLILLLFLFGGEIAKAEDASAIPAQNILTEEQVVEKTLKNNYDLRSIIMDIELAKAQLEKAGLWPNPEADFTGVTDQFYADQGEGSYEYGLSQAIPISGRTFSEKKVARLGVERAQWQVKDFERQLKAEAKKNFYQVITLQEKEKALRLLVETNRNLPQVVKSRLNQAEVSTIDVNLANGSLQLVLQEHGELKARLYEAKAKLNRLMGASVDTPIEIKNENFIPDFSLEDLKILTQKSLENRPDLKAKQIEEQIGKSGLTLAKALRIPDITVGGFYHKEMSRFEVNDVLQKDDAKLVGIKVSVPIPLFNRKQGEISEAKAQEKRANIEYEGLKLQVEQEVAQAYIRGNTAKEILDSYQQGVVTELEKSFKLIQEAYAQGQVSFFDVVQIQEKFIGIQKAYLEAIQERRESLIDLESAIGISLAGGESQKEQKKEGKNP